MALLKKATRGSFAQPKRGRWFFTPLFIIIEKTNGTKENSSGTKTT